jgi:hypothetical protein
MKEKYFDWTRIRKCDRVHTRSMLYQRANMPYTIMVLV